MASFIGNLLEMQLGMEKKESTWIKPTKQMISLIASKLGEEEEEVVLAETKDKLNGEWIKAFKDVLIT